MLQDILALGGKWATCFLSIVSELHRYERYDMDELNTNFILFTLFPIVFCGGPFGQSERFLAQPVPCLGKP